MWSSELNSHDKKKKKRNPEEKIEKPEAGAQKGGNFGDGGCQLEASFAIDESQE